jgi:hypothetical protein
MFPQADDSERAPRQPPTHVIQLLGPASLPSESVFHKQFVAQRQKQGQHRGSNRPANPIGRNRQCHASPCTRFDIHAVITNPKAGDDRQPLLGAQ